MQTIRIEKEMANRQVNESNKFVEELIGLLQNLQRESVKTTQKIEFFTKALYEMRRKGVIQFENEELQHILIKNNISPAAVMN
jgi:hypothetical protein